MCGVLGIKKGTEMTEEFLNKLIESNHKRGKASSLAFDTPWGSFFHFRAPTTGCNLNNLSEAYPLTYKGWGLIGNGVINETFFKSIKDESNNNDLYYILKNVAENGFDWLKNVDGCFALVFFNKNGNIMLVRNTFPLYVNSDIFSSTKFKGSQLLEQGVVYNWTIDKVIQEVQLKPSPYLL